MNKILSQVLFETAERTTTWNGIFNDFANQCKAVATMKDYKRTIRAVAIAAEKAFISPEASSNLKRIRLVQAVICAMTTSSIVGCANAAIYFIRGEAKSKATYFDKKMSELIESIVQILISMNAPGTCWLDLT